MTTKTQDVPRVSLGSQNDGAELIDAEKLASRWKVPESWVRNRTRARTPKDERIPHVRLGRYVRFAWGSPALEGWLTKRQQ